MKRHPLSFFSGTIILLIILVSAVSASTENNGNQRVFIFDASGSMWGQIKGTAKIQIAKEVLADMIMDLPGGINVGLVA